MKSVVLQVLIISLIAGGSTGNLFAQKKKSSKLKLEYYKSADNSERLEVGLIVKLDKYRPFSGAMVELYSGLDSTKTLIGEFQTNEDGIVSYTIDENSKMTKDSLGFLNFMAIYAGNDSIKPADKDISVKQGNLDISFFQKDSVKSIKVVASEIDADGELIALEGKDILFFVKGTFSLYKFGEGETDENGSAYIEFPTDMPGDTAGVLGIVVKIDDDKKFGTIEAQGKINWGSPIQPVLEKSRGLGDTDAPLWMVYTLITLLSAVWLHYVYVIYLIFKIRIAK